MTTVKTSIKTILKYFGRFLLGIFSILILYFLLAFILSVIPKKNIETTCTEMETIYLISNGVHLDIVLEVNQLDGDFWKQLNAQSTTKYIAFGWGDKGFYLNTPTWNELKASTVVNALLLKSESAMHVTNYHYKSKKFVALPLCASQLETLKQHIETSFLKNTDGKIVEVGQGYGSNDNFYEAIGSYNAIKTCNEWVNIGLKKSAVKTSIWSPFDKGILYHLEK